MNFLIGKYTDKGIKKDVNQDALMIKVVKSPYGRIGLFAVADGMGGLSSGELASSTLIQYLNKWFELNIEQLQLSNFNDETILKSIELLILEVNDRMVSYGKENGIKLGTTISLMLTIDNKYYVVHVGDSRVYKIDKEINILTEDHTFIAREIKEGRLTKEEGMRDKRRNMLLQCVGAKSVVNAQLCIGELKNNEVFMICSDGMYKRLLDEEIKSTLSLRSINSYSNLDILAESMARKVMDRNEVDNISVIIIKTIS